LRNIVTVAIVAALVPAVDGASVGSRIGIYHWGGRFPHSITEGVQAIAEMGGKVARIALSSRYYRDYNISPQCYPDFTLAAALDIPDVREALEHPAIEVYILTAYDGASFGDCERQRFLDPEFYSAENTAALVQEYSDFTLALYRRYQGTRKKFIVSNWESDNAIYCGHAYYFATVPAVRDDCTLHYAEYAGVSSPEEALRGLKLWLQARARGMLDGRLRALAEGIGGMRVYAAPEINIVRALRESGWKSVLYDVLPSVMFDYVSYSAYESINAPDPSAALHADLDTIAAVIGSNSIIVGETGFSRTAWGSEHLNRSSRAISAALDWGVDYVIQWQLYDSDGMHFGLYDLDGKATGLKTWFEDRFRPRHFTLP
jgi:hypothetical protein